MEDSEKPVSDTESSVGDCDEDSDYSGEHMKPSSERESSSAHYLCVHCSSRFKLLKVVICINVLIRGMID